MATATVSLQPRRACLWIFFVLAMTTILFNLIHRISRSTSDSSLSLIRDRRSQLRTIPSGESRRDVLCNLKRRRLRFQHLVDTDEPFASLSDFHGVLPPRPSFPDERRFRSCGVVSSSGALLGRRLGSKIDAHDAVFRFNHAPTDGFESDVGAKTTVRLVNSKCVEWACQFLEDRLFRRRDEAMVVWDPGARDLNYTKWWGKPEYKFFHNFVEFRRKYSEVPAFIAKPEWIWGLHDVVQTYFGESGSDRKTFPPTSGFFGSMLAMEMCDQIVVYEYIASRPDKREPPVVRDTLWGRDTLSTGTPCHYWEPEECDWLKHPRSSEQKFLEMLHVGDKELIDSGILILDGFRSLVC